MSEQLGFINYPDLGRRQWKKEDFQKGADYVGADLRQYILSRHSYGVIQGCEVTVVAGMTIQIAEGLIIFPNGKLVSFSGKQVNITDADGAQDRYDRVALQYSIVDGDEGTNIDGEAVVIDKEKTAVENVSEGALGGAVPANIAGEVSLCAVTITAGVAALTQDKINQSVTYRGLSKDKQKHQRSYSLANDIDANTQIGDIFLDPGLLHGAKIKGFIRRKDENQNKKSFFDFDASYDDEQTKWLGEFSASNPDTGIYLNIEDTGEVTYQSTTYSATDYECILTILDIQYIFRD